MSTSGGDLTLLADAMAPSLTMPPFSEKVKQRLRATVHDRVVPANPFDYQMFNWDDQDHMVEKFTAFLAEDFSPDLVYRYLRQRSFTASRRRQPKSWVIPSSLRHWASLIKPKLGVSDSTLAARAKSRRL
jgi:hypothetical protein